MVVQEFTLKLCVALVCGLLIGLERQINRKEAGMRTHSLVALGSAIFILMSYEVVTKFGGDVTRIIGQVVTGVGFICAGVIMHKGANIHGLTTSATIWCASAVGCIAAGGYFAEAFISTALVIFVNAVLKKADMYINARFKNQKGEDDNV